MDFSQAYSQLQKMVNDVIGAIPNIIAAGIVFALLLLLGRVVRAAVMRVVSRYQRDSLGIVLGRLAQWGIVLLAVLIAAVILFPSVKPADVLNLLGIGSVAIGFAFQDVLQNLLSGILLLITEPFRIGDQIKFGDYEGTVENIQTRATIVRTYDGRRVVIPNGELYTRSVTVNTSFEHRRVEYDIYIGYGDDIERAKQVILQVLRDVPNVLDTPAPDVLCVELSGYSVGLRARWWISPPKRMDALDTRDQVLSRAKAALTAAGIDLPFPTQQVLFHDQTEVSDGDRRRQREGWPAGENQVPRSREALHAEERQARSSNSSNDDRAS